MRLIGRVKRRGHPAIRPVSPRSRGSQPAPRLGHPAQGRAPRQRAHRHGLHPGPFAQDACPSGSRIGQAKVTTPILDQPLEGPVYLRSSSHKLPDLVLDLKGQIDIEPAGKIDTVEAGSAPPSKGSPTRRSLGSSSISPEAQGAAVRTVKPSARPATRRRR